MFIGRLQKGLLLLNQRQHTALGERICMKFIQMMALTRVAVISYESPSVPAAPSSGQ